MESNRSNLEEESNNGTNREEFSNRGEGDSARDNIPSARSYRTEQGMTLNDLVVEMYDEMHMIIESLPNIEKIKGKLNELVENFIQINETLNKYQSELKQIVDEEVENMKKELVQLKGDFGKWFISLNFFDGTFFSCK